MDGDSVGKAAEERDDRVAEEQERGDEGHEEQMLHHVGAEEYVGEAIERRGEIGINSPSVVRSLVTIAFAIFIPNGGKILDRLAVVLGGNPTEPAELLNQYVAALVSDDKDTLSRVEECIQRDPMWTAWFARFSDCALAFPYLPRVIGVSPVPSSALVPLLATMFKEVTDADCSRDNAN